MSRKPVIVFEGIEGSGKTHHLNKVSKYLKKANLSFIKIREPGGSLNSEKLWLVAISMLVPSFDTTTPSASDNGPEP